MCCVGPVPHLSIIPSTEKFLLVAVLLMGASVFSQSLRKEMNFEDHSLMDRTFTTRFVSLIPDKEYDVLSRDTASFLLII